MRYPNIYSKSILEISGSQINLEILKTCIQDGEKLVTIKYDIPGRIDYITVLLKGHTNNYIKSVIYIYNYNNNK